MEILQSIIGQITGYIEALDWGYIATFILIGYLLNTSSVVKRLPIFFGISCRTRYRVAFIGVLYAVVIYLIRGKDYMEVERLFRSFVFAMVFHQLIIDLLVKKVLRLNTKEDEA